MMRKLYCFTRILDIDVRVEACIAEKQRKLLLTRITKLARAEPKILKVLTMSGENVAKLH